MRYFKIDNCDLNNGDGLRVTLWVSGCSHGCVGCHNQYTHNENHGDIFDKTCYERIKKMLGDKFIQGLTITGGDPFFINNREELLNLLKFVKKEYPNKDIWVWTGYKFEELPKSHLEYIDVIIDGKFEINNKTHKKWRGSDNQKMWKKENNTWRIID